MSLSDLVYKFRQSINPPYSNINLLSIGTTLLILLLIPITVLGIINVREPRSRAQTPPVQTQTEPEVEYVSNEILIKLKPAANGRIKSKASATSLQGAAAFSTGVSSLDKLNKDNQVAKLEKVVKEGNNSKKDHEVFRWYKVTLPGKTEILKDTEPPPPLPPDTFDPSKSLNKPPSSLVDTSPQAAKINKLKSTLALYQKDPNIESAEFNYIVRTTAVPNDPYYSSTGSWGQAYDDLWGLKKIQMEKAWDVATGSAQVTVAVADTGIDYNHPDISSNIWTNSDEIPANNIDDDLNGFIDDTKGWDFYNNDNDPADDNGHGTHVAGTIGAIGNNNIGVVGVNWQVKIMPVKFLGADGSGSVEDGASAIVYATDKGARVLNNSWLGPATTAVGDAINYAHSKNVVVVAGAGNSNSNVEGLPAGHPLVITVAASDSNDKKASFSSYGNKIDVIAPGVDILSLKSAVSPMCTETRTVGTNYCRVLGTSMASPHVAGLTALILWLRPNFSNEDIRQVLRVGADDIVNPIDDGKTYPGFDIYTGYGRINATRALQVENILTSKIDKIQLDSTKSMIFNVEGTSVGPGFVSYEVLFGKGTNPTSFQSIKTSTVPIQGGFLAEIDVGLLSLGDYTVKLAVTQDSGFVFYSQKQFFYFPGELRSFPIEENTYGIPTISSNGNIFFAAWNRYHGQSNNIAVARLSEEGEILAPGVQEINNVNPDDFGRVSITSGRVNSLVVFLRYPEGCRNSFCADIYGVRISQEGNLLDPNGFLIHDTPDIRVSSVSVATDGDNYLVTWIKGCCVYGSLVKADGVVLNTAGFVVSSQAQIERLRAGIINDRTLISSFDGTNYFIVWGDGRNDFKADIYGTRVSKDGIVLDPEGIPLVRAQGNQLPAAVVFNFNADYYILAYGDDQVRCCSWDIWAMRINRNGNPLDPEGIPVVLNGELRHLSYWSSPFIDMTIMGRDAFIVWEDTRESNGQILNAYDIYGARINHNGTVIDPEGFRLFGGQGGQSFPKVATVKRKSFIIWYEGELVNPIDSIYGGLVSFCPNPDPDTDNDGLSNCEESGFGTDPTNPDSDSDGLIDGTEVNTYFTNPLKPDTDGDGLKDGEEVNTYKTNPLVFDTDKDGCSDGEEIGPDKTKGGKRNPLNPYDFYDITNSTGILGKKDDAVTGVDLSLLLRWGGARDNSLPNTYGNDYDSDNNNNGIEDGRELDFAGRGPGTGPDGIISGTDLSDILSQGGNTCLATPAL